MPSSFGQYTGGIAPVQGISEAGARIGQMAQQGYQDFGKSLAGGIAEYAKNKDMDDAATQELDSSASELARFAQSIKDIPELGNFSEELNAKSEEIIKARTGNRGAKLSAASNARQYTSKIGDSLNFYRGIQGIREQRAFNEGNNLPTPAPKEYTSDRLMSSKNFYSWDNKKTEIQNLQGLTGKYNELKSKYPNLRFRPIDEFINEWTANNVYAQDPNNSKTGTIDGFSVQDDSTSPVRKDDDSVPRHPITGVKIITPEMLGMPSSESSVTRNPSRGSMLGQRAPAAQTPAAKVAPAPIRVQPPSVPVPESLRPAPRVQEQAPPPEQNPVEAADSSDDLGYSVKVPLPAPAVKTTPAPVANATPVPVPETLLPPEYYANATEAPPVPVPESLPAPAAKSTPKYSGNANGNDNEIKPEGTPTYEVKKGEVLTNIAKRKGITTARLAKANGLNLNHGMFKGGEKLYIPPAEESSSSTTGEDSSSESEDQSPWHSNVDPETQPVEVSANALGEQKAADDINRTMAFHAQNNGKAFQGLNKEIDNIESRVRKGDFSDFTRSTYDNWKLTQPEYYGGIVRPLEIIGEAGAELYGGKLLGKLGSKLMPAAKPAQKRISEFSGASADATRPLLKGVQKELSQAEMLAQGIDKFLTPQNIAGNATNLAIGSRALHNTVDYIAHPDAALDPTVELYRRIHGGKQFINGDTGSPISAVDISSSPVYQKYNELVEKSRGILGKAMGSGLNAFQTQDFDSMTEYQKNVAKIKIFKAIEEARNSVKQEVDTHNARYESLRIKTPEERLALARGMGDAKIGEPNRVLLNPSDASSENAGNTEIEVAQQIESLPQTAQARRQQVMGFVKSRLGYVPLGFNDMYKKEHPEESLQFYQHPQLGAFYTDGGKEGWKPVPVAKNGITQKDIAEAKAVTFGTPTANGFQGEEFIKGSGYKLSGIGAFGTPTDASAFRESYRKLINAKIAVKQLDAINEKLGRSWNPVDWGKSAYLVSNLIAQMRVSLIGAGSVSDFEQKLLKELVQNPTDFFSLQSTTRAKYKTIVDKLNLDLETLPQSHGLTVEVMKDRKEQTANLREILRQRESDAGYQKLTNNGRGVGAYSKLSPEELDAEQLRMDTEQSMRVQSPQR